MFLSEFTGFHGASLALLASATLAGLGWLALLAWRWFATFPYLPDAGPATNFLGEESPAVVGLLVHRWNAPRSVMAATLLDLAARGLLAIEQYGDQVVVRVYEERIAGQRLNQFESQLLEHIRARIQGRSAPVDALDLGEDAESFWKRFRKHVEGEARAKHLARSRWTNGDRALLGGALAAALGLLALALGASHLGESTGDDDIGTVEWIAGATVAWFLINGYLFTRRSLRDTPAGSEACGRWLGVRQYIRDTGSFGDLPAAAVTTWDRYLGYGVALGVAHRAAEDLPFDIEDPDTAWSRHGGDWRELRVEYPAHLGATKSPTSVLLQGLWQTVLFGALAFWALPIAAEVAWDVAPDILAELGSGDGSSNLGWIIVALVAFFAAAAVFLVVRSIIGAAWLFRGLLDLAGPEVIEGEVVKTHDGRVAIDDGLSDEIVAWIPPATAPRLNRGMLVRAHKTRRLHYVSAVEVLASPVQAIEGREAQPEG